jgi:hypothetical protein
MAMEEANASANTRGTKEDATRWGIEGGLQVEQQFTLKYKCNEIISQLYLNQAGKGTTTGTPDAFNSKDENSFWRAYGAFGPAEGS